MPWRGVRLRSPSVMILARRAEVHVAAMAFCIHGYLAPHSVVQDRPSVIRALITDWGHVDR
jgi:hypothetical protein